MKDREINSSVELNKYNVLQINEMADVINQLKEQISDLEKDREYDKNRYEKVIKDMNKDFMMEKVEQKKANNEGTKLLISEIKIREQIQFLLLGKKHHLENEIRELKKILMIPKLQYKYIENMKLESLKSQNEKIAKEEIEKIMKQNEINQKKHSKTKSDLPPFKRRSLNSQKRSESSIIKDNNISSFSNFGFGESSLRLPSFIKHSLRKSPSKSDNLDNSNKGLDKKTFSTRSTIKSFLYDRSSPMLSNTKMLNKSDFSSRYLEKGHKNYNSSREQSLPRPSELDINFLTNESN